MRMRLRTQRWLCLALVLFVVTAPVPTHGDGPTVPTSGGNQRPPPDEEGEDGESTGQCSADGMVNRRTNGIHSYKHHLFLCRTVVTGACGTRKGAWPIAWRNSPHEFSMRPFRTLGAPPSSSTSAPPPPNGSSSVTKSRLRRVSTSRG